LPSPRSQTSFDDNPAGRLISVSSLSSLGSLPHPGQRLVCLQVFPFRLQRLTLLGPVLPSYKCVALRVSSRWTANYCCVSQKAYPQTKKDIPGPKNRCNPFFTSQQTPKNTKHVLCALSQPFSCWPGAL
jgi:hypothetical protein